MHDFAHLTGTVGTIRTCAQLLTLTEVRCDLVCRTSRACSMPWAAPGTLSQAAAIPLASRAMLVATRVRVTMTALVPGRTAVPPLMTAPVATGSTR